MKNWSRFLLWREFYCVHSQIYFSKPYNGLSWKCRSDITMHHRVRRGESLYKIAKRHGTTVHRLLHKNPHLKHRSHLIYPGETVRVR